MNPKKRSPLYQWEQEMIDAYYDDQWSQTLDSLYDKFQHWKAGGLSQNEMDEAIHITHKSCQKVYNLFTTNRDLLVRIIQIHYEIPNAVYIMYMGNNLVVLSISSCSFLREFFFSKSILQPKKI